VLAGDTIPCASNREEAVITIDLQHRSPALDVRRRAAIALLAFVVVILPTLVATLSAQAQTFTVLYSFQGQPDGDIPSAALVQDGVGNLYGTTSYGGLGSYPGYGIVFKVDTSGIESVLYSFTGRADGASPDSTLVLDAAGDIYGTAISGGTFGLGTVFKVGIQGLRVLHTFSHQPDGASPVSLFVLSSGVIYGMTAAGGANGDGTLFNLDAKRNETVLHSFGTSDGGGLGYLTRPTEKGIAYGTTFGGLLNGVFTGYGTIFQLNSTGTVRVLYRFTGGADGKHPAGGLILDTAGNIYGTTSSGGYFAPSCAINSVYTGCGVVFKLDTSGNYTVLHSFLGGVDGAFPQSALVRDMAGNLYGTTVSGGAFSDFGMVFKLDTSGNYTVLHSFSGGNDGSYPNGLLLGADGSLYGTTGRGGLTHGVVFKLIP
jgi:uncharacterized repeat protein (TIGR03803 family)